MGIKVSGTTCSIPNGVAEPLTVSSSDELMIISSEEEVILGERTGGGGSEKLETASQLSVVLNAYSVIICSAKLKSR